MDLETLFKPADSEIHPYCKGCSIRSIKKPFHAMLDYEKVGQVDVLFLVDSLVWDGFSANHLSVSEEGLFDRYVKSIMKDTSWTILASVKCPDVKEKEMTPTNRNACRNHLTATINKVKPKLIFTCGNLPLVMLLKESGVNAKRGSSYYYGDIPVVPLFHPMQVILEPRRLTLFQMDIHNGYNKYILHDTNPPKVDWTIVEDFYQYDWLISTGKTISIDIETTGLNFLKDKIQTVGISYQDGEQLKQLIIPVFHKEAPTHPTWIDEVKRFLVHVCANPSNRKILQNAKFDMKFLLGLGITVTNVYDTKLESHFVNENLPKSLRDLVKQHFPEALDDL